MDFSIHRRRNAQVNRLNIIVPELLRTQLLEAASPLGPNGLFHAFQSSLSMSLHQLKLHSHMLDTLDLQEWLNPTGVY